MTDATFCEANASNIDDLLLCFDKNFIFGAGALLCSIAANNPLRNFCVHLSAPKTDLPIINDRLIARLKQLYTQFSFECYAFEDFSGYEKIASKVNARMAAQSVRVFASDLRNLHGRTLLYLDVDIICCGNIPDFSSISFQPEQVIWATDSEYGQMNIAGVHLDSYFFSGLMFINLQKWTELNIGKACTEFISTNRPKFPDQDALNVLLKGHWQRLPSDFHTMWTRTQNTVFVHYVAEKPWEPWNWQRFSSKINEINLFRHYAKVFEPNVAKWLTFRQGKSALLNYTQFKERTAAKWMSKRMKKSGRYAAALYFYYRHIRAKIKQKGILGFLLCRSNTRS